MMEFIQGGRVDDLQYLADHDIDRNKVALELARIFAQMVHLNGWFHAVSHIPIQSCCRSSSTAVVGSSSRYTHFLFLNLFAHLDVGNLLIRPASPSSRSPYNFDIVLLDHGLYFDLDDDLRINYSKFWLSLIAPASAQTNADRRKYAKLVGNIGDDLYPVFEAAITGTLTHHSNFFAKTVGFLRSCCFRR